MNSRTQAPVQHAFAQLLSSRHLASLECQWAVWSQIREGSRSQQEEGDASPTPLGVTEAEGEGQLEPAANPDQKRGAIGAWRLLAHHWRPCNWGERS